MIGTVFGFAVAAVIVWFVIRASVYAALAVLLATTFLIPGSVLLPGGPSSGYSTIHHFALALFVLNVLRKLARGEIAGSAFKPTRPVAALGAWVTLTFVLGVGMADQSYQIGSAVFLWVFIVEYAIFYFFVVAAIRAIGDPWKAARLISALIVVAALVAIYEHVSGVGFGRWVAERIRAPGFHDVFGLGTRGGDVRVQAGFDFALAYGWAAAILLPMVVVVATRARNRLFRLAPAILALSIAWTYARSVYAGVAVAGVMLLLTTRFEPRVLATAGVGLVVATVLALTTDAYDRTFRSSDVEGSTLVREERLPLILVSAAESPLTGKGLGSVGAAGFRTTDSLFLLTYAEIGVVGLTGLVLLLVAMVGWIVPGLRAPPPDRLLGAAAVCGLLLGIASGAFVDGFTVSGLARTFWLVAAVGTVVAERAPKRAQLSLRFLRRRMLVPVAAVIAGMALFVVWPTSASTTLRFTTRAPYDEAIGGAPNPFADRVIINTACEIIEARVAALDHHAQCYDLQSGSGLGDVRFEAPDAAALRRDLFVAAIVVVRRLPTVRFFAVETKYDVKPTWVRTAPVWLGLTGLSTAFLLPPIPPIRSRRSRARSLSTPVPA